MKPFEVLAVKDRDGNLLEENRGEPTDVIRADTAFVSRFDYGPRIGRHSAVDEHIAVFQIELRKRSRDAAAPLAGVRLRDVERNRAVLKRKVLA